MGSMSGDESGDEFWKDLSDDESTESTRLQFDKGRSGLQKALLRTDKTEWFRWLQSDILKPFWVELWDSYLKTSGKKGARGVGLAAVQETLIQGEKGASWGAVDHLARFMYWVRKENLESCEGVFYGRNMHPDDIDQAIWILKNYLQELHSESQINKKTGGTAIFGTKRHNEVSNTECNTGNDDKAILGDGMATMTPSEGEHMEEPCSDNIDWVQEALTPKQKIRLNRLSPTYKKEEVYWQIIKINRALDMTTKRTPSEERLDEEANDNREEEEIPELAKDTEHTIFDPFKYDTSQDFEAPLEVCMQEDQVEVTQEDIAQLREQQSWLNNEQFQRDNHEEACEKLDISDPKTPHLKGMVGSAILKFWQVVAVWWLIEIMASRLTKGAILADAVGLGKTYEAIAFIIALTLRKRTPYLSSLVDKGDKRAEQDLNKPVLIIVPPHLIEQWAAEIHSISRRLELWIYYGDDRTKQGARHIQGKLKANHPIFHVTADTKYQVILSTYQTMEARHGLSAVKDWHKKKFKKDFKGSHLPNNFPNNLSGRFGLVVCDEAHQIRNPESGAALAVWWLDAAFHLLITATPFWNSRNADFLGYMRLLLLPLRGITSELKPEEVQEILKAKHGDKDFEMLLGMDFVRKYILHPNIDSMDSAIRMRKLLSYIMLRRTLASCLPLGSQACIGQDIPPCQRQVLKVFFNEEENEAYRAYWIKYRRVFIKETGDDGRVKFRYNMDNYRKLVLAASWIGMIILEKALTSKNMKKAIVAQKKGKLIGQFMQQLQSREIIKGKEGIKSFFHLPQDSPSSETSSEDFLKADAGRLAAMLRGSAKMRVMLGLLRDQVLFGSEKAIIWVNFPAEQMYVLTTLQEAGFDAVMIDSGLDPKERNQIVQVFTTDPAKHMILVLSYQLNSSGLNLQRYCRYVHLFTPASTKSQGDQAIGRNLRVGQTRLVIVYDYRMMSTFQATIANRAATKALPAMLTDISCSLAAMLEPSSETAYTDRWVIRDGKVLHLEDTETPREGDVTDPDTVLDGICAMLEGLAYEPDTKTNKRAKAKKRRTTKK
ncbi:uncharacterized protein BO87DRAFT_435891 [Aspergillus neoniger CBS 115656]|uniref:Helicase ATP-binding domain-containing protein n=1 Tax=Aspergillus neoniger (strain CBS 115656) TaxID=1448310 RepID=A0A318ZEP8_ASPNB|nr:hypothetical protein BO87DRAFT_435891 [Aspergillus neoniger CBS 115656]PYH34632.1 hypothetical protein BO87DRAFT_435891 [Aspergillus neoniger CBS 115656]